nr:MAG TPA: hypothetical protein [Caudoviricetes sp.]
MIPRTKVLLISTDVYKMRNYFYSIELFRFSLVIVDKGQKKCPYFHKQRHPTFFYYES